MNNRRPSMLTSTQPQFYFVRHPSTYWHPALLINEAEDISMALRRVSLNPNDDRLVSYKLYDPSSSTTVGRSVLSTQLSELGSRIPSIASLATPPNDLVQCDEINEAVILYSVIRRYEKDKIYTAIGDILVAVNPFRVVPGLYDAETMLRVHRYSATEGLSVSSSGAPQAPSVEASSSSSPSANDASSDSSRLPPPLPPHVYNLAAAARHGLIADGVSQSIVISGESGSGKTENTKRCLQFLAFEPGQLREGGGEGRSAATVEDRLLDANPILEAFGNAKTIRNNNSSRFGKFMKIRFTKIDDLKVAIVGCHTDHYLLEKARLVERAKDERSFHIFYQLLNGADASLSSRLDLTDGVSSFSYLSNVDLSIPNVDDGLEFRTTLKAFDTLGFSPEDVKCVLTALAGILHIGNVRFDAVDNFSAATSAGSSSSAAATPPSSFLDSNTAATPESTPHLNRCAKCLGIDPDRLDRALSTKERTVKKELIASNVSVVGATYARDALAKKIYGLIFEWLLDGINGAMTFPKETTMKAFIGVLDIFGFEIFAENRFEQLCINFCNEKLQKHFIQHVVKLEEAMYASENLAFIPSHVIDNQDVLDLIEEKRVGLLAMLDEESKLAKGSDAQFLSKATKLYDKGGSARFKVGVHLKKSQFIVHHYAGSVTYDTNGWLDKNRDELSAHIQAMMEDSSNSLLKKLFVDDSASPKYQRVDGERAKTYTEGSQFVSQLTSLINELEKSRPHFIRCVKPNEQKSAKLIDPELTMEQLRYSGVLEVVKIRKQGFPFRPTHEVFWQRYWPVCPFVQDIVREQKIDQNDDKCMTLIVELQKANAIFEKVEYGITRIFYRTEQHEALELLRQRSRSSKVVVIQKIRRGYVCNVATKQLAKCRAAIRDSCARLDVESLHQDLLDASDLKLRCVEVKSASVLLEKLQNERRIRDDAKAFASPTERALEDSIEEMRQMQQCFDKAELFGLAADPAVVALAELMRALQECAVEQEKLLSVSSLYDRELIEKALASVATIEQRIGRPFCKNAKSVAQGVLREIAEEIEMLEKLKVLLTKQQTPLTSFPLTFDQQQLLGSEVANLQEELFKWEEALPRSAEGLQIIESVRVMVEVRATLAEETWVGDNVGSSESMQLDYYLDVLDPAVFSPVDVIKEEVEHIIVQIATARYVPRITNLLAMSIEDGPVGGMSPSRLEVDELEEVTKEAMRMGVRKSEVGKNVIDQAHALISVRKHWKAHAWEKIQACTAATSLPSSLDLVRKEITWASMESRDRLIQRDITRALELGSLKQVMESSKFAEDVSSPEASKDSISALDGIEYKHVEELLISISRTQQRRSSFLISRSATFTDLNDLSSMPLSSRQTEHLQPFSSRTVDLFDTALLTVEIRKYQKKQEWGLVLSIFDESFSLRTSAASDDGPNSSSEKTPTKSNVSSSAAKSSSRWKDDVQIECMNIRRLLMTGVRIEDSATTAEGEFLCARYPRAIQTEEIAFGRGDASRRILTDMLIPALSRNKISGTINDIDCSNVEFEELGVAIRNAQALKMPEGVDDSATASLIALAKNVFKWRRALKYADGDFTQSYSALVSLADDPSRIDLIGISSMGIVAQSAVEELDLVIGQVRFIQALTEVPLILESGAASGEPGNTNFDSIDYFGLDTALSNFKHFPESVRNLPSIRPMFSAVRFISLLRQAQEEVCDETKQSLAWEQVETIANEALAEKVVEQLPPSCSSTVAKELHHALEECAHQIVCRETIAVLEKWTTDEDSLDKVYADSTYMDELTLTLKLCLSKNSTTAESLEMISCLTMARDVRQLQTLGQWRDVLELLSTPRFTLNVPERLAGPIESARADAENRYLCERIYSALSSNAIHGLPGELKLEKARHDELDHLLEIAGNISRKSPNTMELVEITSAVSGVRRYVKMEKYDKVLSFLNRYDSSSSTPSLYAANEMDLVRNHVRVETIAERLYDEVIGSGNTIPVHTHLEGFDDLGFSSEAGKFGHLKVEVRDIDLSRINTKRMRSVIDEASQLWVSVEPCQLFQELLLICEAACELRELLAVGNYVEIANALLVDDVVNSRAQSKRVAEPSERHSRLITTYYQERLIAKQEVDNNTVITILQQGLPIGGVQGEIGNVRFADLSVKHLAACLQQVGQIYPRTKTALDLVNVCGSILKIRNALLLKPRDWNAVQEHLNTVPSSYVDFPSARDEINLVIDELSHVRVVSTLCNALDQGWDRDSAVGSLKHKRIDTNKLVVATDKVISDGLRSKACKDLFEVATIMKTLRINLKKAVDPAQSDNAKASWDSVRVDVGKMLEIQKDDSNSGGKVTRAEVRRVKDELMLFDASNALIAKLMEGAALHANGELVSKGLHVLEPHIASLDGALTEAVKVHAQVPAESLKDLIKSATAVQLVRKCLMYGKWDAVENECIRISRQPSDKISEGELEPHAREELLALELESHNLRVLQLLRICLDLPSAVGSSGNLDYKDLASSNFAEAFKVAFNQVEKAASLKVDLRAEVLNVITWSRMIYRLREAQVAGNFDTIDSVLRDMVLQKQAHNNLPPAAEKEFELARDDAVHRKLVQQYKQVIKRGGIRERDFSASNWCVLPPSIHPQYSKFSNLMDADDAPKGPCPICLPRTLGQINKGIETNALQHLIEIEGDEERESDSLAALLMIAKFICALRKAFQSDVIDFETVRGILGEWSSANMGYYVDMVPEAQKELKLAQLYLRDHDAQAYLKKVFERSTGSFYYNENQSEFKERARHKSKSSVGLEVETERPVGRRYSIDNEGEENIDFETIDITEIEKALVEAKSTAREGRSKETKLLLHTVTVVGDLRKAMKEGNWPKVGELISAVDQTRVHNLALAELDFVKYQLKVRKEQKLLLEGIKVGSPPSFNGFVDSVLGSSEKLEGAVRQAQILASRESGKRSQSVLHSEVQWLIQASSKITEIRHKMLSLDFDGALAVAVATQHEFTKDSSALDVEWKHLVTGEVAKYADQLSLRQRYVGVCSSIDKAASSCDVITLKKHLLEAESIGLDSCPNLYMKTCIINAKHILKSTMAIERRIAEDLRTCNFEKLTEDLRLADKLNLVTEVTQHAKKELKSVLSVRQNLATAVATMNYTEIARIMGEVHKQKSQSGSATGNPKVLGLPRMNYEAMPNFKSLKYVLSMPPSISNFIQFELAKLSSDVSAVSVDDESQWSSTGIVSLSVRQKEMMFASPENQKRFSDLSTFSQLRPKEEFARRRMITDDQLYASMLSFSTTPIVTSLTILPVNLSTLAVRIFSQNILGWVNSRKFTTPEVLVQQVLAVCSEVPGIRDEVFCQIMKQLNGVPSDEIEARLWCLMNFCVETFPPSQELENYLEHFLLRNGMRDTVFRLHESIIRKLRSEVRRLHSLQIPVRAIPDVTAIECAKEAIQATDFKTKRIEGCARLAEMTAEFLESEWATRFRLFSGGRDSLAIDEIHSCMYYHCSACLPKDFRCLIFLLGGDINAVRGKRSADEFSPISEERFKEYLENVHDTVLAKMDVSVARNMAPGARPNVDKNWFKCVYKVARSQMYRIKAKKCGRTFRYILHPHIRAVLQREYEDAMELAEQEALERENESDESQSEDEVELSIIKNKQGEKGAARRRGGGEVRRTETGEVISHGEKIKMPNLYKMQDREKKKKAADAPHLKKASVSKKRGSSANSSEQLEQESDDACSDASILSSDDDLEAPRPPSPPPPPPPDVSPPAGAGDAAQPTPERQPQPRGRSGTLDFVTTAAMVRAKGGESGKDGGLGAGKAAGTGQRHGSAVPIDNAALLERGKLTGRRSPTFKRFAERGSISEGL